MQQKMFEILQPPMPPASATSSPAKPVAAGSSRKRHSSASATLHAQAQTSDMLASDALAAMEACAEGDADPTSPRNLLAALESSSNSSSLIDSTAALQAAQARAKKVSDDIELLQDHLHGVANMVGGADGLGLTFMEDESHAPNQYMQSHLPNVGNGATGDASLTFANASLPATSNSVVLPSTLPRFTGSTEERSMLLALLKQHPDIVAAYISGLFPAPPVDAATAGVNGAAPYTPPLLLSAPASTPFLESSSNMPTYALGQSTSDSLAADSAATDLAAAERMLEQFLQPSDSPAAVAAGLSPSMPLRTIGDSGLSTGGESSATLVAADPIEGVLASAGILPLDSASAGQGGGKPRRSLGASSGSKLPAVASALAPAPADMELLQDPEFLLKLAQAGISPPAPLSTQSAQRPMASGIGQELEDFLLGGSEFAPDAMLGGSQEQQE